MVFFKSEFQLSLEGFLLIRIFIVYVKVTMRALKH